MGELKKNTTLGDKVWGWEKRRRGGGKKGGEKVRNSKWQIASQKRN